MGGASCLSPFFSSAAELFGAKHFSRMTPRGKNEPACFGKSCWQFPVEVAEGRDQAGISSPHSLCKLCALRKFRPNVVLQGPSSLGWVWLQVDAPAISSFSGWEELPSILWDRARGSSRCFWVVCQVVSGSSSPPSGPAPLGDRQLQRAWALPLHCTAPLPWGIFSNL